METKSANPNVAVDPETGMVWDVSDPSHPVRILPMDTKPVSSDVDLWLGMKNKVTPPTNQELGINPNMRLSTPYGVARPKTTDIPLWQKGAQLAINEPLVQMIPPKGFENNEWIQRIGEMASIVPNLAANIYKKPASAAILPAKLIESGMQGLSVSDKAFAQAVTEPFRGQKTYGQWSAENPLGSLGLELASPIGWIMPGGKIKKGANIVEDVTKLLEKGTARDLIKKVLIETEQAGRKFSESEAENLLKTAEAKVGNIPNVTGAIPPRTPPPVPPIPPIRPSTPPIGGTITPSLPSEMQRIITQAAEQVKQDKPGAITNFLQKIPGIKQILQFERPGLKMLNTTGGEKLLIGHVAEAQAKADVATRTMSTRLPLLKKLETAFGRDVVHGGKSNISFTGTVAQAANPITGTLKDIADNPELYNLTDAQKALLTALNQRNDQLLSHVTQGYGADIGRFPAKVGGAYLPNVDIAEDVIKALGSETRAVASGRAKTRIYDSARERMLNDPTFKPELDVQKLIEGLDSFKASAAGGQTFRNAIGGLTKLEVLEKTHPKLFTWMTGLRKQLADIRGVVNILDKQMAQGIDDFLASPMQSVDLLKLTDSLEVQPGRYMAQASPLVGKTKDDLFDIIKNIRQGIKNLKPQWDAANTKPYQFIQEGIYKYFPAEQVKLLKEMRQVSDSPFVNFIEKWRGQAFSGDVSPFAVQGSVGVLADPIGSLKALGGALQKGGLGRTMSIDALAQDIAVDVDGWSQFASLMGRILSGTPQEFSAGFLSKIPKFDKFTEATYITVTRESKSLYDRVWKGLVKDGLGELQAKVSAANIASEILPLANPRRLGQSQARASLIRALPTSYSFIRQPAKMMGDATKGFAKLITGKPLTPSEKVSVNLMLTMGASVLTVSATSAAISAQLTGKDVGKETLAAINPDPKNGKFASIIIGDFRIPIGGPYRALFRAIFPAEVKGIPVPVPFAGLPNYLMNRVTPAVKTQISLLQNKDYYGNTILKGNTLEQFVRGLAYEVEGAAPLSIAAGIEGIRTGAPAEDTLQQMVGQFAGTNVIELTPNQKKNDLQDKIAREKGFNNWNDKNLDDYTRNKIIAETTKLQEAIDKANVDLGKKAQDDARVWIDYKSDLQRVTDAKKNAYDMAVKHYKDTGNGYRFRNDISDADQNYYASRALVETNPKYKVTQDYYKQPLDEEQIKNMNPKDFARRQYYNLIYSPGIYDKYGKFDFNVFEQRQNQFVSKYGQAMMDYIDQFSDLKKQVEPPELKELRYAKKVLAPYWDIESNVWNSTGNPQLKGISDMIIALEGSKNPIDEMNARMTLMKYPQILFARKQIALMKQMYKMSHPEVGIYLSKFYD